jgi:hypothetical protein
MTRRAAADFLRAGLCTVAQCTDILLSALAFQTFTAYPYTSTTQRMILSIPKTPTDLPGLCTY